MKSIPAASAMRARRRQSAQLASQRSGTLVAERPEEQFAPNTPTLSVFALYMPRRSRIDPLRIAIWLSLGSGERTSAFDHIQHSRTLGRQMSRRDTVRAGLVDHYRRRMILRRLRPLSRCR